MSRQFQVFSGLQEHTSEHGQHQHVSGHRYGKSIVNVCVFIDQRFNSFKNILRKILFWICVDSFRCFGLQEHPSKHGRHLYVSAHRYGQSVIVVSITVCVLWT